MEKVEWHNIIAYDFKLVDNGTETHWHNFIAYDYKSVDNSTETHWHTVSRKNDL
jgi:hypothetical protein